MKITSTISNVTEDDIARLKSNLNPNNTIISKLSENDEKWFTSNNVTILVIRSPFKKKNTSGITITIEHNIDDLSKLIIQT